MGCNCDNVKHSDDEETTIPKIYYVNNTPNSYNRPNSSYGSSLLLRRQLYNGK